MISFTYLRKFLVFFLVALKFCHPSKEQKHPLSGASVLYQTWFIYYSILMLWSSDAVQWDWLLDYLAKYKHLILTLFIAGSLLIFHLLYLYQSPQKCPFSHYLALMISNGLHSSWWYVTRMEIRLQFKYRDGKRFDPHTFPVRDRFCEKLRSASILAFSVCRNIIYQWYVNSLRLIFSCKKFSTDSNDYQPHYLPYLYLSVFRCKWSIRTFMIYISTTGELLFNAYLDRQIDFNGFSFQWLNYLDFFHVTVIKGRFITRA